MRPEAHNSDINYSFTCRCFSVRISLFISPFINQFPLYMTKIGIYALRLT